MDDKIKEFAKEVIRIAFEGGSLDGGEIQDMAEKHGLLTKVEYNPKIHGWEAYDHYGIDYGDDYYVFSELLND